MLGLPVFFRHAQLASVIRETMDRVRDAGLERIAAIAMAPQFSELSVGAVHTPHRGGPARSRVAAEIVWARSFHDEPLLIEAFAEKLEPWRRAGRCSSRRTVCPRRCWGAEILRPRNARHGRRRWRRGSG